MEQIDCINLCDILSRQKKRKRTLEDVFAFIRKEYTDFCINRIYLGSYFCGKQFLMLDKEYIDVMLKSIKEQNIKITLVIPVLSQGDLKQGKKKIKELLVSYDDFIDEVTVNDFGMLCYIAKEYNQKLNLGRMLQKDYRDPRFEEYFQQDFKPKVFTDSLKELIQTYPIKGMEFDPTHRGIDLSELPEGIEACVHTPYSYMTVGRICEYASVPKQIEEKFRPNAPCKEECSEKIIKYRVDDLDRPFIRAGRAIYFKNPDFEIKGADKIRVVYWPIEMEVEV